jgi:hypothetical protein
LLLAPGVSRALPTALALAALFATAPARADGWYFTEGVGGTRVQGPMAEFFSGPAIHLRVGAGRKIDRLAVEAYFAVTSPLAGRHRFQGVTYDALSWGLDLRYVVPLSPYVSAYARGGLGKMTLEGGWLGWERGGSDYTGRTLSGGAGVQVSGKVRALGLLFFPLFFTDWGPKVTAAAWLDTGRQYVRLHNPTARSLDGELASWTFGIGLGSDF